MAFAKARFFLISITSLTGFRIYFAFSSKIFGRCFPSRAIKNKSKYPFLSTTIFSVPVGEKILVLVCLNTSMTSVPLVPAPVSLSVAARITGPTSSPLDIRAAPYE